MPHNSCERKEQEKSEINNSANTKVSEKKGEELLLALEQRFLWSPS